MAGSEPDCMDLTDSKMNQFELGLNKTSSCWDTRLVRADRDQLGEANRRQYSRAYLDCVEVLEREGDGVGQRHGGQGSDVVNEDQIRGKIDDAWDTRGEESVEVRLRVVERQVEDLAN